MRALDFVTWSLIAAPLLAVFYIVRFSMLPLGNRMHVLPKCAGSFVCVSSAGLAVHLSGGNPFTHPVLWALAFCMLGDLLIEWSLWFGGGAFAVGHCILIFWILGRVSLSPVGFLIWAAAFALVGMFFIPDFRTMGTLKFGFIPYAAILTADFAAGVLLFLSGGAPYLPLALGLFSFVVSDVILGKNRLGRPSLAKQKALMLLYYLALYLIAATMWFVS